MDLAPGACACFVTPSSVLAIGPFLEIQCIHVHMIHTVESSIHHSSYKRYCCEVSTELFAPTELPMGLLCIEMWHKETV